MNPNIVNSDIKIKQLKELRNGLNYQQLLYFLAAAQELSISRAARMLGVGQPGLSQQLQKLEDQLGEDLFVKSRGRGGMKLTDYGAELVHYAERVRSASWDFLQATRREKNTLIRYRIGASPSTPDSVLEHIAHHIIPDPTRRMSLIQVEAPTLLLYLENEQIDFLISDILPQTTNKKIERHLLLSSSIYVCGHKNYFDKKHEKKYLFENCPLIFPGPDSPLAKALNTYFHDLGINPNIHAEIQDSSMQIKLAGLGEGLVFLNEGSAQDFLSKDPKKHKCLMEIKDVTVALYLCHYSHVDASYMKSLFMS